MVKGGIILQTIKNIAIANEQHDEGQAKPAKQVFQELKDELKAKLMQIYNVDLPQVIVEKIRQQALVIALDKLSVAVEWYGMILEAMVTKHIACKTLFSFSANPLQHKLFKV